MRFFLWRGSCMCIYKYSHVAYRTYNCLMPIKPLLTPFTFNKSMTVLSVRHFSWNGFYYSLSSSPPIQSIQHSLLDFHDYSGLPWWAIILLTTLSIRTFLIFPLAVHQSQVIARYINLKAELQKMAPELNKEVNIAARMYGWNELKAKKIFQKHMRKYRQKFIIRDNCHPFKIILLGIFQVPIWVCFSVSLRNLTMLSSVTTKDNLLHEQFRSEGLLWFTDLTIPDFFIPIFLAVVNLILTEIHTLRQIEKGSKFQKIMLYLTRFMVIMIAGVACLNPASVSFYWLCSSTFGLTQSMLLMLPRFRRFIKIPHTPTESATPFKDIIQNFKKKFVPWKNT